MLLDMQLASGAELRLDVGPSANHQQCRTVAAGRTAVGRLVLPKETATLGSTGTTRQRARS